jgi:hypothetical protein
VAGAEYGSARDGHGREREYDGEQPEPGELKTERRRAAEQQRGHEAQEERRGHDYQGEDDHGVKR